MAIDVTKKKGRRSGAGAPGGGAKRGSYDRGESSVEVSAKANITESLGMYDDGDISRAEHMQNLKEAKKVLTADQIKTTLRQFNTIEDIPEKAPRFKKGGVKGGINKGGMATKKPMFMKGGSYKGKSHMYAAGGMVKELKI